MADLKLVDTNVYISFYNRGLFGEELLELHQRSLVLVSAVTLNEFVRGAHDPTSKQIAAEFLELMQGQIITPTQAQWTECGVLSEKLLKDGKRTKLNVLLLQNDLLIALGARDAGATLVTSDKKDFSILLRYVDLHVDFW